MEVASQRSGKELGRHRIIHPLQVPAVSQQVLDQLLQCR
jgi:hypothetical protein